MSRLGKKSISLPKGVTIKQAADVFTVTGPKGTLTINLRPEVSVSVEGDQITVSSNSDTRFANAMHGTTRSLISNMIKGASEGYLKELDVIGVGWTAQLKGKEIHLNVGYADVRKVAIPAGITCEIKDARIKVLGVDKQLVGQVAAVIRSHRKPEPYNGKGICYVGEKIIRKEGKAFGS